jgi:hypothetical protein
MTTVKTVTYGRGFTHTLEQPIFTGIFEGQRRVPLPAISADITGMMEYLIKVRWDGAKSKFILTGENGQEAEFEPQPKGFYKDVKWYVQNYSDSETFFIERALDVEARIESHCEDIWTALTSKNFLDHRFLSNHKITATIYIDEDLQSPPPKDFSFGILWELLELKQTAKMVHPVCRVVRIAASQSPRKPAVAIGPGGENVHKRHLRILFVVARELNNKSEIDPELILKALFQMKKSLPIGGISLEILRPGTFNALKAQLEDASKKQVPFDMVHFDVHGEISEKV